ncbi:MAG: hypothetical protein ACKVP4_04555 [Hyphomicrobium sp.]
MLDRLRKKGLFQLAVAAPVAAAIAHIIATFIAAGDTRASAFVRLSEVLKSNVMTVLEPVSPSRQLLPFISPDARYAMCYFTTGGGPVRVTAVLPDLGWTLGVYRQDGSSAYFAAAAPGRETSIAITIVPDDDRFLGMTPQALGKSIDVNPQLTVAARDGVVVVRAPDSGSAARTTADAYLEKTSCSGGAY